METDIDPTACAPDPRTQQAQDVQRMKSGEHPVLTREPPGTTHAPTRMVSRGRRALREQPQCTTTVELADGERRLLQ